MLSVDRTVYCHTAVAKAGMRIEEWTEVALQASSFNTRQAPKPKLAINLVIVILVFSHQILHHILHRVARW